MNCRQCPTKAVFVCLCSDIYTCQGHVSSHLIEHGEHRLIRLPKYINTLESSIFSELYDRISTLIKLKKNLIKQANCFIKKIQKLQNLTLKKISNIIQEYCQYINNRLDEEKDLKQKFKDPIVINFPDPSDLMWEINRYYSQDFLMFEDTLGKQKKFLQDHNGGFFCMVISNDGKTLVTGSQDSTVRVWDLHYMTQLACYCKHTATVQCLALSNDGSLVLSGSYDKKVILWDLNEGTLKNTFSGHSGIVYFVSFFHDELQFISGSYANEIFVWSIKTSECLKQIETTDSVFFGVIYSSNEFISATNTFIEIWDLDSLNITKSFQAHSDTIWAIVLTYKKKYIITGSADKNVKLWSMRTLSLYGSHNLHEAAVLSISITPDDLSVISGSEDNSIILWSIKSKHLIHKFSYHVDFVYSVKVINNKIISASRDSRIGISSYHQKQFESFLSVNPFRVGSEIIKDNLVAFGRLNDVIITDLEQFTQEQVLSGHPGKVTQVSLSSKNDFLISASVGLENNLIVWDLRRLSMISVLNGHLGSVFCVDVSGDDSNALSAGMDTIVRYWDLLDFRQEFEFKGHLKQVYSVKFTKNKDYAASGGGDNKVMVWDLRRKELYACLEGHSNIIWKVLFTSDDKYIVSADYYKGIRIWSIIEMKQELGYKNLDDAKEWLATNKEIQNDLLQFLS